MTTLFTIESGNLVRSALLVYERRRTGIAKEQYGVLPSRTVEDVLRACYRSAERGEECDLLSAADIFQCLKKRNPAAMRGANPASLAQILVAVGIERKHTKFGNVYRVISV